MHNRAHEKGCTHACQGAQEQQHSFSAVAVNKHCGHDMKSSQCTQPTECANRSGLCLALGCRVIDKSTCTKARRQAIMAHAHIIHKTKCCCPGHVDAAWLEQAVGLALTLNDWVINHHPEQV